MVPDGSFLLVDEGSCRCGGCRAEIVISPLLSGEIWPNHSLPASAVLVRDGFGGWLVINCVFLGLVEAAFPDENVAIVVAVGLKRHSLIEVIP